MQVSKKLIHHFTFFVVFLLSLTSHAAPSVNPALSAATSLTITLQNLISQDGFTLSGFGAGRELYLPILPNWAVNDIQLHLLMSRDKTINKNTVVTALINGTPISSINLSTANDNNVSWDISIPQKYLHGKLITLQLSRDWNARGVDCTNTDDDSSWIHFSSESTINYHYTEQAYQPNLALFPAPFINDPSLQKENVFILLPEHFINEDLIATFYVANTLLEKQTWRGLNIIGLTEKNATLEIKNKNNIIMLGVAKQISAMTADAAWPLKLNTEGLLIDHDNHIIPNNTGVILNLRSPWNPNKALLIVTGNSSDGVIKAAQALRLKEFKDAILFNQYTLITTLARPSFTPINWSDTTFAELGYKDKVIYGSGENSMDYDLDLPMNKIPTGMDISLKYSVSPLLSTRNSSFIALKTNGFPITGTRIGSDESKIETWNFHINKENLLPGKNLLHFIFNLKFYNKDCSSDDVALAWATIYANSHLKTTFDNSDRNLNFSNFNITKQNISIFLSQHKTLFTPQQLLELILNVANNIFYINQLHLYSDDAQLKAAAKNSNIIYIGSMEDNPQLNNLKHHFPFCYINNKLVIKPNLLPYLHISDEIPIALIELIPSPFNDKQAFLLLTADNMTGTKAAIDTFFNPQKSPYLRGDAALIYSDGTFTSIDTKRLEMKAENVKLIDKVRSHALIGFIVFIAVFFGGLISIILFRRAKKYFSRTPGNQG